MKNLRYSRYVSLGNPNTRIILRKHCLGRQEQARLLRMQAENVQERLNRIRARRVRNEKQQRLSLSSSTRGTRQEPIEVD